MRKNNPRKSIEAAGFAISDWCESTDISRALYYTLPPEQQPESVKVGRRRIIIESPDAYLRRIAARSFMRKYGFSENTLSRAIGELLTHGMIYRTRSGGYQQGAAQYAVTWLPIKDPRGLFLKGFKPCAWRDWTPAEEKTRPPNLRDTHLKNGKWTTPATPKIEVGCPPKTEDIELVPCRGDLSTPSADASFGVDLEVDLLQRESGAHPKETARPEKAETPPTCRHPGCETLLLSGRVYCAKHRNLASAHTSAALAVH